MRVTDSRINNLMVDSLRRGNNNLAHVMDQISSGNRITRLSDDPSSALKITNLESEARSVDQYVQNIDAVSTKLIRTEIYVSGMHDTLLNIRDLVLYANNETKSDGDYGGIKAEIENLKETLQASINTQDASGNYIFSGSRTDTEAITEAAGVYTLNANDDEVEVIVGEGLRVTSNISAEGLMAGDAADFFDRLDSYIAALDVGAPGSVLSTSILETVDAFSNNVGETLTELGGRQNYLDAVKDNHQSNLLFMNRVKVEVEQLDIAEASVRLNSYMDSLEATHLSFQRISSLKLFDRL